MKFLVFVVVLFAAATRNGVFMSKTANPRIVADGLGLLGPMPDHLACWIDDISFFGTVMKIGLNWVL